MITQDELKRVLEYNPDTGIFTNKVSRGNRKAGSVAGSKTSRGYIQLSVKNRREYAHRLAFLYMEGYIPEVVDHIDRDTSNNRWKNLRDATYQDNSRNKKASSLSGYLGITWDTHAQKWKVRVTNDQGVQIQGGLFPYEELEAAITKANNMRAELHGKYAVLELFSGTIPPLGELNK